MTVNPADREVLLVEYQKAQDSAEHHDNLVGNVTSLWLGSAIFIGFVLSGLTSRHAAHYKWVLYLVIALGMLLTFLVWTWANRASTLKKLKYDRCKEIEQALGMEQHLRVGAPQALAEPRLHRPAHAAAFSVGCAPVRRSTALGARRGDPRSGDIPERWPRRRDGRHGSQPSRYADRSSGPKRE